MQVSTTSAATAPAGAPQNKGDLDKAARQFEAIFLRQMIGAMRSASLADGITDSSASDQFRDMADARTADAMAGKGAMGIAQLLMQQFSSRVADTPSPTAPDGPTPAQGA